MSDRDTLAELIADDISGKGWRPPAREISDPAGLSSLPVRSIVLHRIGIAFQKNRIGGVVAWFPAGSTLEHAAIDLLDDGPVTVLHIPTEEARRGE